MKIAAAVIVVVLGLLCLAAGIVYFTQPAHSLPSFFPSHTAAHVVGANIKHTKKGLVAVVVGAVVVIAGVLIATVKLPDRPPARATTD